MKNRKRNKKRNKKRNRQKNFMKMIFPWKGTREPKRMTRKLKSLVLKWKKVLSLKMNLSMQVTIWRTNWEKRVRCDRSDRAFSE